MDPFLGEIRLMPYQYTTLYWLPCQGQLLSVAQYQALFSLLGTTFGGNGQTTFGLPDLRGRAIVGQGQGPGLSNYKPGQQTGTETVKLAVAELPAHTHAMSATVPVSNLGGTTGSPQDSFFAQQAREQYSGAPNGGTMAPALLYGDTDTAGGGEAHNNMMPYLVLAYCIATNGVYPQPE
ncbi:tail fiber protein [Hymenobacter ginsengisoli]|uniref:Tail fiber protein n=1 Tax=Hymenobacter ginsengisoli TaxID=1051626 RepID=A0ABP8QLX2_9BACT|nr:MULTISPECIES: tail fiber protein [unclassified Hymenobacter]MBO2029969.1 phage tail protein [Hymenobacter sp. BT559]